MGSGLNWCQCRTFDEPHETMWLDVISVGKYNREWSFSNRYKGILIFFYLSAPLIHSRYFWSSILNSHWWEVREACVEVVGLRNVGKLPWKTANLFAWENSHAPGLSEGSPLDKSVKKTDLGKLGIWDLGKLFSPGFLFL